MNLKAIKLPDSVIISLYSNNLIEGESSTAVEKNAIEPVIEKEEVFQYLGNNEKKVLILVNNPGVDYLQNENLTFLTNMLSACKLSIQDVAILNIAGAENFSYRDVTNKLATRVALLIDAEQAAIGLPLDFPFFQVQPFNGITFLSSPSLSEIKNDPLLKSKLWVCLRRIFNV